MAWTVGCFTNNTLKMMSRNLRMQTQKPFAERKICMHLEFHSPMLVLNGRADEFKRSLMFNTALSDVRVVS